MEAWISSTVRALDVFSRLGIDSNPIANANKCWDHDSQPGFQDRRLAGTGGCLAFYDGLCFSHFKRHCRQEARLRLAVRYRN